MKTVNLKKTAFLKHRTVSTMGRNVLAHLFAIVSQYLLTNARTSYECLPMTILQFLSLNTNEVIQLKPIYLSLSLMSIVMHSHIKIDSNK